MRGIRKNAVILVAMVTGVLLVIAARAAERDTEKLKGDPQPLHFQRLLVPSERPEDWPRKSGERYLPMPADEFEQRLAILRGEPPATVQSSTVQLINAEYSADLVGTDLVGQAIWAFSQPANDRSIAMLEGCRLALSDAKWIDHALQNNNDRQRRKAIVGNDQLGRLAAVIERPGRILCKWSSRAVSNDGDGAHFDLMLPACPKSVLEVTLPDDLMLHSDRGIISMLGRQDGKKCKWRLELGGFSHVTLGVVKQTPDTRVEIQVRQSLTYEFSSRGMEVTADLGLNAAAEPLRQITLRIDSPLEPVRASIGTTELPITAGSAVKEGVKEFNVELPQPIQGTGQVLHVSAVAPAEPHTQVRLPLMQVAGAHWEQGSAQLTVKQPLVLGDLLLKDCRQTGTRTSTGDTNSEIHDIQFFREDPTIKVVLSRPQEQLTVASGTSITLRANEGRGRCQALFSISGGSCFSIEADIASQWIIDNVESSPPGLVSDWSQQSLRGRPAKLKVQLGTPLTSDRSLQLIITGLRRRWVDSFRADDLAMLSFNNHQSIRQIIHVQALEPYQLQLRGDENLHRLSPEKLTASDAALFEGTSNAGLMFVNDEFAHPLVGSLTAKAPQFEGEIRNEALVTDDRLTESYSIAITPQGREISRLAVRLSQPRSEPLLWTVEGEPVGVISARRLVDDTATSRVAGGDTWEIALPVARSTPFVLAATRRTAFQAETPLALATLIGADTQQGTIQVSYTGEAQPEVRSSRRVKDLPIEKPREDQLNTPLAAFRYDPDEDALISAEPPLVLVPSGSAQQQHRKWIWQQQLQSIYYRTSADHVFTCRVEAVVHDKVQFVPPANASLKAAWIDNRSVIDDIDRSGGSWTFDIAGGARLTTIVLQWTEDRIATHMISQHLAPWPTCDLPILARQWTVWLPPDIGLVDAQLGGKSVIVVPWTKRLFGPLASSNERADDFRIVPAKVDNLSAKMRRMDKQASSMVRDEAFPRNDESPSPVVDLQASAGLSINDQSQDFQSLPSDAWNVFKFSDFGDSAISIQTADEQWLCTWSWALFVGVAALRWWIGGRTLVVDVLLIGLLTAVALLVPPALTMVAAAVWLGCISGRLLIWFWKSSPVAAVTGAAANASRPSISRSVGTVTSIALIFLSAGYVFVRADEAAKSPDSVPQRVWQVLIPVDSNEKPMGGMYYLTESLHGELLKQTAAFSLEAPHYLITDAIYGSKIFKSPGSGQIATDTWHARFEIETLGDNATIELPLGDDGSALLPGEATIDGQPAIFHRDDKQRGISIDIPLRGSHQLELRLWPMLKDNGFNFVVPRVSEARIDVEFSGIHCQVDSMLGAGEPVTDISKKLTDPSHDKAQVSKSTTEPESGGNRQSLWLGPADRVVISRIDGQPTARLEPQARCDIEELYWLHIHPNAVTIDARFKVEVLSGRLQHIDLEADPRLVAEIDEENSAVADARRVAGDSSLLRLTLARPTTGHATIDASFVLKGTSGVGHIRLPVLETRGGKTSRRSWAATVDASLVADANFADGSQLDPREFITLWGNGAKKPQFSWNQLAARANFTFSVRPREPEISAHYQMALLIDQREASFREVATVTATNDQIFQCRISVPQQLEIEHITARQENTDQLLHWIRSRPDLLTIFLDSPFTGEASLSINGRIPVPADGKLVAPLLQIESAANKGSQIAVLRHQDALVSIADPGGFSAVVNSSWPDLLTRDQRTGLIDPPGPGSGKTAEIMQTETDARLPTIHVERNAQQMRVAQATTIYRVADVWTATVDLAVTIDKGLLDAIRFELPANWIGPFEVSPSISSVVQQLPGENRRQLILRPDPPFEGNIHLRIAGPLTIAAGQRPSVPDVRLVGATNPAQFVLLPRSLEDQQLEWDRRGMVPRPLPGSLSKLVGDVSSYRSYQAVAYNARAQLKSVERGTESPQVRLADIELLWALSGQCVGVASFDLEPGDAASCQLAVPTNFRLIRVELDNAPAQLSPLGSHQWNIDLGNNKLPRRLEMIFSGMLDNKQYSHLELAAPTLVGLPVERTLWHIFAPAIAGPATMPAGKSVSALEHNLLRFKGTASLAEAAGSILIDEPTDDAARWFVPWLHRFARARSGLVLAKSAEQDDDQVQSANAELNVIDQDLVQLAHRLELSEALGQQTNETTSATDWLHMTSSIGPSDDMHTFAMLHGDGSSVAIVYPDLRADDNLLRTIFAAMVLAGSGAMVLALRCGWIPWEACELWPQALGIGAGAAWWLWLAPNWLGLVIIFASLSAASWPNWRSANAVNPKRPVIKSGSNRLPDSVRR